MYQHLWKSFGIPWIPLPLMEGEGGEGGGNSGQAGQPGSSGENPPEPKEKPKFSDDQQALINSLVAQAEKKGEQKATAAIEAAQKKTQEAADQAALEAKGEYETAKSKLTTQVTELTGERDSLMKENEDLSAEVAKIVEDLKGSIPAEALEDFDEKQSPLDQLKWLRRMKGLVDKLAPLAAKSGEKPPSGAILPNAGQGSQGAKGAEGKGPDDKLTEEQKAAAREEMRRSF